MSLAATIAITITLINAVVITIVAFTSMGSYADLAEKQSRKLLELTYERTTMYFDELLRDALQFNLNFRDNLIYNRLHEEKDMAGLEKYLRVVTDKLAYRYEQIAVVSYGDELGRYIGFRINEDKTTSLMLKDGRTGDVLLIFNGNRLSKDVISVFDEYSPQDRPWYVPVKANPITQWSEIYVNYDELNNLTITVMSPVLSDGRFQGIAATDVSLDLLDKFLKKEHNDEKELIYILDRNNQVMAQSGDNATTNPDSLLAVNSANPVIANSMRTILDLGVYNIYFTFLAEGDKYYAYVGELDHSQDLGLKAVVIIPESEVIADMQSLQNKSLYVVAASLLVSILLAMLMVNVMLSPVKRVADFARLLSISNFQYEGELDEEVFHIKETYELVEAFNHMTRELKSAFDLIRQNEAELEAKVAEKTLALEQTYEELLESEKLASLGGLVAGVSHEVNTPIGNAVAACSYIVEERNKLFSTIQDGKLSKQSLVVFLDNLEESTEILQANLDRAAEIIQSFKQISVNQTSAIRSKFLFKEYLESIFVTLRHEYKNKPFKYEIDCDDDLEVDTYPGTISHIFTNLIINALKHAFIEGQELVIKIQAYTSGGKLVMKFSDNGAGISPDNLKRIFDPFFTTSRVDGGSGLGLSIVYNLVTTNLGGTISCHSVLMEGTTMTIIIPLEAIDEGEIQ